MNDSKNLWGGRFTGETDEHFAKFNRSYNFDKRLFSADLLGCTAHCEGLRRAGILSDEEADKINGGLEKLFERSKTEHNFFRDDAAEDVHSFIENRLAKEIGDVARKLHTGRSRNDQVATALRIWLREAIDELHKLLHKTVAAFVELAEQNQNAVLPGYTHLQRAQPVLFAHWCLAYVEMLRRDAERLQDARKRTNVLPLGAAALAGTAFAIDREAVAKDLEFASVARNSLDAVSDRDFAVEFVHAAALVIAHLSRFAEDAILYATAEFGFLELSDAVATGSSIMPQKKNPDSLELIRGKTGRIFGDLIALLTTIKGLPLAYNKDLQEDKEAIFDAFDTTRDCLRAAETVLRNVRVNTQKMREAAMSGFLNATELADYLVRKGTAFRAAHETTGKIVLRAIELGVELNELELDELQKFSDKIDKDVFPVLSLNATLATKNQTGGTAPARVAEAIAEARAFLEK